MAASGPRHEAATSPGQCADKAREGAGTRAQGAAGEEKAAPVWPATTRLGPAARARHRALCRLIDARSPTPPRARGLTMPAPCRALSTPVSGTAVGSRPSRSRPA